MKQNVTIKLWEGVIKRKLDGRSALVITERKKF